VAEMVKKFNMAEFYKDPEGVIAELNYVSDGELLKSAKNFMRPSFTPFAAGGGFKGLNPNIQKQEKEDWYT
jgi:hypothetical protein